MSTLPGPFATHAGALTAVDTQLRAALAEGRVEDLPGLVAIRGDVLARLTEAFAAASPPERLALQPAIRDLARQERQLTEEFVRLRDEIGGQLARTSSPPGVAAPGTPSSLDRRA